MLKFYLCIVVAAMTLLAVPSKDVVDNIAREATKALGNRMYKIPTEDEPSFLPKICAVCDGMMTIHNPSRMIELTKFVQFCDRAKSQKTEYTGFFPPLLVDQYTAKDERLKSFVLSPLTIICTNDINQESVMVCFECSTILEGNPKLRNGKQSRFTIPPKAIWNGILIGDAPECLSILRPAELALLSPNRVVTHAMTMYANHHDGIYGWHTMFENKVDNNVRDINELVKIGLDGEIVVVLCGPFTKTQDAIIRRQMTVRTELVKEAFAWLKLHNIYFNADQFDERSIVDIPQPIIIEDSS